jgi:hypothetical protein
MKLKYLLVLCLFFQVGCGYSRVNHFRKEFNACLENDQFRDLANSKYVNENIEATCILEANKKDQIQLEKIRKGDWYNILYKITYNNIKVTKGNWEYNELTFLSKDSWPTEESGIVLRKPAWPFRDNVRMVFEIAQTPERNLIVRYYPVNLKPLK